MEKKYYLLQYESGLYVSSPLNVRTKIKGLAACFTDQDRARLEAAQKLTGAKIIEEKEAK